ncbi:hypothetical protein V5O48_013281 [Marasmius crinis-equi]|uniref:Zn(2)-C6 fungal-type domain-containing protein n=1 Tax=Marasmius crinis-equi TaxID=585013 RepID=A0ABR3F0I2_9AGAR
MSQHNSHTFMDSPADTGPISPNPLILKRQQPHKRSGALATMSQTLSLPIPECDMDAEADSDPEFSTVSFIREYTDATIQDPGVGYEHLEQPQTGISSSFPVVRTPHSQSRFVDVTGAYGMMSTPLNSSFVPYNGNSGAWFAPWGNTATSIDPVSWPDHNLCTTNSTPGISDMRRRTSLSGDEDNTAAIGSDTPPAVKEITPRPLPDIRIYTSNSEHQSRNATGLERGIDFTGLKRAKGKEVSSPIASMADVSLDAQLQIVKSFRGYHNANRKNGSAILAEKAWAKENALSMLALAAWQVKCTNCKTKEMCSFQPERARCIRCFELKLRCSNLDEFRYIWAATSHNVTVQLVKDLVKSSTQGLKISRARATLARLEAVCVQEEESSQSELSDDSTIGESMEVSPLGMEHEPTDAKNPNGYEETTGRRAVSSVKDLTTLEKQRIVESYASYRDTDFKQRGERRAEKEWVQRHAGTTGKCQSCNLRKMCVLQPRHASCTRCWNMGLECSHFVAFKTERVAKLRNVSSEVLRDIIAESLPKTLNAFIVQERTSTIKTRKRPRIAHPNNDRGYEPKANHNDGSVVVEQAPSFDQNDHTIPSIIQSLKDITVRLEKSTSASLDGSSCRKTGVSVALPHDRFDTVRPPMTGTSRHIPVIEPPNDNNCTGFGTSNSLNPFIHDIRSAAAHNTWTYVTLAQEHLQTTNYHEVQRCLDMAIQHCGMLNGSVHPDY